MKRVCLGFVLTLATSWCRAADITPPQLVTLSLSTTNVEVSESNQTILVTARITDDLSGMGSAVPGDFSSGYLSCGFLSPSRKQQASFSLSAIHRVSGNEWDGIYTNQLVLPRYGESGVWTLQHASVRDAAGNQSALDYAALLRLGILVEFNVTGTSDTNPPECLSFSFSPDLVDSVNSNRIQFTVRLKDDLSGIAPETGSYDFFSYSRAEFRSPSGLQGFSVIFYSSSRNSGDALDGVYTNSVLLLEFREPGVWTLEGVSAHDAAGNQASWAGAKLLALGFPTSLTITGMGDTNPPLLAGFSLTPTNVNTTHSGQSIAVMAQVTDDLSGFGIPSPFTGGGIGGVSAEFTSPSGNQSTSVGLGPSFPASGVTLDASFTNSVSLPRYSEPGLWLLRYLAVVDKAGNYRQLDLAAVRNLGLPYSFTVEEFPRLEISRSEGTAIVSWPAYAGGFKLQTCGSLSEAADWSDVLAAPVQIGERLVLASSLAVEQRFYRLIKRP